MITLYSGTPGSGKSFHAVKDIQWHLKRHEHCIINFYMKPLNSKNSKYLHIIDTFSITPEYLYNFAKQNHKKGKEHQSLLVIDEAGILFNSRDYNVPSRREWLKFMQVHRHFGFDIILISQFDRMLDRQIRCLIENESIHRSIRHYKLLGMFLGIIFRGAFIAINYWYGCKLLLDRTVFIGSKKIYKSYNSFDDWVKPEDNAEILKQEYDNEKRYLQAKADTKLNTKINRKKYKNKQIIDPADNLTDEEVLAEAEKVVDQLLEAEAVEDKQKIDDLLSKANEENKIELERQEKFKQDHGYSDQIDFTF